MNDLNIPPSKFKRVVVIGAGFGGINLVKHLRSLNFQVVLIDRNNYHLFQPLLYQVATGGLEAGAIAFPIRKIIKVYKNVFFRITEVESIDITNNNIINIMHLR